MKKEPQALDMSQPIKGVQKRTYNRTFDLLSKLEFFKKKKYRNGRKIRKETLQEMMYILTNYSYLIYERIKLKPYHFRDTDWDRVKLFAAENRWCVRYLLKECFQADLTDFERLMHKPMELIECQMYRAGTHAGNKHIFG